MSAIDTKVLKSKLQGYQARLNTITYGLVLDTPFPSEQHHISTENTSLVEDRTNIPVVKREQIGISQDTQFAIEREGKSGKPSSLSKALLEAGGWDMYALHTLARESEMLHNKLQSSRGLQSAEEFLSVLKAIRESRKDARIALGIQKKEAAKAAKQEAYLAAKQKRANHTPGNGKRPPKRPRKE